MWKKEWVRKRGCEIWEGCVWQEIGESWSWDSKGILVEPYGLYMLLYYFMYYKNDLLQHIFFNYDILYCNTHKSVAYTTLNWPYHITPSTSVTCHGRHKKDFNLPRRSRTDEVTHIILIFSTSNSLEHIAIVHRSSQPTFSKIPQPYFSQTLISLKPSSIAMRSSPQLTCHPHFSSQLRPKLTLCISPSVDIAHFNLISQLTAHCALIWLVQVSFVNGFLFLSNQRSR